MRTKKASGLRFFNVDLHISVIADVKNIFETFGHSITDWTISGHAWVFGRERNKVKIVNEKTWKALDHEMCDRFYEFYKDFLHSFDGFIVTYNSSFALLYERVGKPIIVVNPTRYENPFTRNKAKWQWLDRYLIDGVRKKQIIMVSNNRGDDYYLKYFTAIDSKVIPSLCLYTNAQFSGKKKKFLLASRVQKMLMPRKVELVHRFFDGLGAMPHLKESILKLVQQDKPIIQSKKLSRLIAYKERELGSHYTWQDLYDFNGIIHIPYQISTMSIFEEYSANVPLFFPSKEFLFKLHKQFPDKVLSELSFYQVYNLEFDGKEEDNPNNVSNEAVVRKWISLADFYDEENMPFIQYFDSFEHLEDLLLSVDCIEVSTKMREFNRERKKRVLSNWGDILQGIELANRE